MKTHLNPILTKKGINVSLKPWKATLFESCFNIIITVS